MAANIIEAAKELPDYAIQALSAVLSANIDCGLEHFVTMGYHEDHDTRSAFLKVLSNILNQGAEFDAVNEDSEDKYDNLMALVLDPELKVRLSFCLLLFVSICCTFMSNDMHECVVCLFV